MRVEPKVLVRRLTPTCTRALEAGVARANSARCYEILVEHMLLALLDREDGDAARILHHFDQDRGRLLARLNRVLENLRSGNAGRPVFSESLFQWFEDAWVVASLEGGATRIRSGSLIAQFIASPGRYTAESFPELENIPKDVLKRSMGDLLLGSPEDAEVGEVGGAGAVPAGRPGEGAPAGAGGAGGENIARFCSNLTARARKGEIDPIFGRHREVAQMIDILSRRRKNNPIIVGEAGVGKTALAEGLAIAIVQGDVPTHLKNVDLLALDLGLLSAGASVKGEFENRLKGVIAEVKASPKPIILFIDEAHLLIGAGGGNDASNLLKPALARGELRTVAATTWTEYKKYFEKDAALERRFQPVKCDEPSEEDTVIMLRGLRAAYEKAHGVTIRDDAIVAAARLSHRYISGRQLPDKAVDLIDTSGARAKIMLDSKPGELVQLELSLDARERARAAAEGDQTTGYVPDPEKHAQLLAKIETTKGEIADLTARWQKEHDAVHAVRAARKALQEIKEGDDKVALEAALEAANVAMKEARGKVPLVPSEVNEDVVAQVVADWTGIPVGKMQRDDIAVTLTIEDKLRGRVRGQEFAIHTVAEILRIAKAGIRNPSTPVGVLLFVGPSGVGKTETALTLADALYGGERFMTAINMSEFQEKHTVSRLIGSPPGYVGYGEGGVLTEAVRQRPYSVVLLDECEKADLEVMNLFYQVFDKGMLSDGEGRVIDFKNTVIILTSNLASDIIMKAFEKEEPPTIEDLTNAIRPTLSKHFKPALLARMTIVPYVPIARGVMGEIVQMRLDGLANRLRDSQGVETVFDPTLVAEIARRCTEAETGARNVEHILRGSLVPAISRILLERLAEGPLPRRLDVGLSPAGAWRIEFAEV